MIKYACDYFCLGSKKDRETGMPSTTEVVIRLIMADFIGDIEFASHFKEFLELQAFPAQLVMKVA